MPLSIPRCRGAPAGKYRQHEFAPPGQRNCFNGRRARRASWFAPRSLDGTLLASGAPLLTLPNDWKLSAVGENIVIAWNASREAIRAVHDAMPLLVKAKKVTIFTFSARESALHATSEMLSDHLLRHGVVAQISDWPDTGEMSALEALFASLDTQNADLIVAGAFGHSRFVREPVRRRQHRYDAAADGAYFRGPLGAAVASISLFGYAPVTDLPLHCQGALALARHCFLRAC
jgi:hypothetical protein